MKGDAASGASFDEFLGHWSRRDFLRRMGGGAALSLFLAGGLELLESCGGGAAGGQSQANAKNGGHVVEAFLSDPSTFNPVFSHDTTSNTVIGQLFAGLLNNTADGTLVPSIAKSVPKVASDQLTYKFDLRTDATWSDGHPLTADDVVFTYALMSGPTYDYKAINSRYWPDLELYLQSVTAPDPHTVVIKTKVPYAPFLTTYLIAPLPKHVLEPVVRQSPADLQKADFNLAPTVTSGPFLFDRWDKSQQVTLKANPKHFLGRPRLDSYVFKIVGDAVQVSNLLKTGEVDVGSIDPSLWDDMATADNINRVAFSAASYEYYGYNMDPTNPKRPVSGKIFGDPETGRAVRQALYLAIDRKQLAAKVYFNEADVAFTVEPKTSWAVSSNVPKYDHDPKKAAAMLDDAGWRLGPGGVRVKDGVKLSFEIITNVGNKTRESAIQVLSESWRQIGVQASPKLIQFPQYVDTANTRDFDMVFGGISAGIDPDLSQIYKSTVIGRGLNRMGYRNQELDRLLDKAVQVLDQGKRKQLYVQVQETLMRDLPTGMLVWQRSHYGVSKRVHNFNVGPFNQYDARPWLKDVWVSDGK